ncbi:MAG: transcriptional repressor [Clostridia bacterium]|nr:transcriptional repressor [Clostridia bacterium]
MIKNTKKRNEILMIIQNTNKPLTAQEIYDAIFPTTSINLSTVYRNLELLCQENILLKEIRNDKKSYYQMNSYIHKHRVICTKCHCDIIISDCPLKKLENAIEKSTGYQLTSHIFELSGICPQCQSKEK